MIKRNQAYLNRISAVLDFFLVFLAYIFSAWFRLKVLHGWWENIGLSQPMIIASLVYSAGLLIMLSILGFYSSTRVKKLFWKLETLFSVCLIIPFLFSRGCQSQFRKLIFELSIHRLQVLPLHV